MGVYNPPEQVLFSPVSNFYQGKAIRQQLAAGEQDKEFKDLQIKSAKIEMEQAPERWAMAKKAAESKQKEFDLSLEQAKRDGRWVDLQRSAQILIPWVQEIGGIAGKNGENSIAAMAKANETSAQMIEQLSGVVSEDQLEALQNFAGSDQKWQPEEFMFLGKYLQSFMAKDEDEGYTLAAGAQRYGADGELEAENIKRAADYTIGDTRYSGETNQPIATNESTSDDLSEKEKEILLYRTLGESEEAAIDLAYDNLDVTSSADSRGNITVTNKRTKEAYQISARAAQAAGIFPKEDKSEEDKGEVDAPISDQPWDTPVGRINIVGSLDSSVISGVQSSILQSDIALMAALEVGIPHFEDGVGSASITQRGINSVLQAVSFNTLPRIFTEETAAADQLRKFNQSVRASLTTSDRGAIWDLQQVERLLPNPDNIFRDPEGEAIKFTQTLQAVSQKREDNVAALNGRKSVQIPRKALGTINDPFIAASKADANKIAADPKNEGMWVMFGGFRYQIESVK